MRDFPQESSGNHYPHHTYTHTHTHTHPQIHERFSSGIQWKPLPPHTHTHTHPPLPPHTHTHTHTHTHEGGLFTHTHTHMKGVYFHRNMSWAHPTQRAQVLGPEEQNSRQDPRCTSWGASGRGTASLECRLESTLLGQSHVSHAGVDRFICVLWRT